MRRPLHAFLVAASLALTGCGPTEPTSGTSTPAAALPTVSRSLTTPTTLAPPTPTRTTATRVDPLLAKLPAAARAQTRAGALAYARFYMTQFGARLADDEKVDLAELHAPDCTGCDHMLETADGVAKHGTARSNPMRISYVGVQFPKQDGYVIQVEWHLRASLLYDAHGEPEGRLKSSVFFCRMDVVERDGHWTVTEVITARHRKP